MIGFFLEDFTVVECKGKEECRYAVNILFYTVKWTNAEHV
jgi:hypothetical protein